MRALRRLLALLVVAGLVLVGADRVVAWRLESGIAAGIAGPEVVSGEDAGLCDAASGCETTVEVAGFPVLTQLLAGRLTELSVFIPGYRVDSGDAAVTIQSIHADIRGVTTSEPYVAQSLTASGRISADTLTFAARAAGLPGTVGIDPEGISFSGTVLGLDVAARLALSIDEGGRGLVLSADTVSIGAREVPVSDSGLAALLTATVPLDALPAGVVVADVTPSQGWLSATLTGTDVDLSAVAPAAAP